jgi:hypothetical protein
MRNRNCTGFLPACSNRLEQMQTTSCVYYLRCIFAIYAAVRQGLYDRFNVPQASRFSLFYLAQPVTTYNLIDTVVESIDVGSQMGERLAAEVISKSLHASYPCR